MTRAKYIAETNSLQEVSQLPEPLLPYYPKFGGNDTAYDVAMQMYHTAFQDYNAHLATLRLIPCDLSCREVFKDGEVYIEDAHYRLIEDYWRPKTEEEYKEACMVARNELPAKPPKVLRVIPITVKTEDEFGWTDELVKEYAEQYRFSSSRISIEQFKKSLIKK